MYSRKKSEETKSKSPQQSRVGSISTDAIYASQ